MFKPRWRHAAKVVLIVLNAASGSRRGSWSMFDEVGGYPAEDIDDILAGIGTERRGSYREGGAGIRHLDGLSFEQPSTVSTSGAASPCSSTR